MNEITSSWLSFLQQHGALLSQSEPPEVMGFGTGKTSAETPVEFVAPLDDLGLIAASGEDAGAFLHNQLTNDIEHMDERHARLAGYCSPKGRLLATLLIWKSGQEITLQLPRSIQPAVQKRLQMFVLRSKVKLSDGTGNRIVLGLCGQAAHSILARWFSFLPAEPYEKQSSDTGTVIRMADAGGKPRYQWITDLHTAQKAWPDLTATLPAASAGAWRLSEIRAGIPHITHTTQEQFVPQMINFDVIGGVNFKKGCYPGQEIVARTQYLGKLKRRMMAATTASPDARAGAEVFSESDPHQPCGMIVNAEPVSSQEVQCLVEIKIAALNAGPVRLGSATGPALNFLGLPYSLPEPA